MKIKNFLRAKFFSVLPLLMAFEISSVNPQTPKNPICPVDQVTFPFHALFAIFRVPDLTLITLFLQP